MWFSTVFYFGLFALGAEQTIVEPTADDVVELTDSNFDFETGVLSGQKTEDWLILFYAPWDPNSRALIPVWHTLAEKDFKDRLNLGRMDASLHKNTAGRFKIKGFPVVLLIRDDTYFVYSGTKNWANLRDFVTLASEDMPVSGYPVPPSITWTAFFLNQFKQIREDLFVLIGRKPWVTCLIFGLGIMSGILISIMVATLLLDTEDAAHLKRS